MPQRPAGRPPLPSKPGISAADAARGVGAPAPEASPKPVVPAKPDAPAKHVAPARPLPAAEPVPPAKPVPVAAPAAAAPETARPPAPASVLGALPGSSGNAVVVTGLTKAFGAAVAVDGLDLVVPAGTFFGLVGPNGAGKTTALSMIAGLLAPDRGSVVIAGEDVTRHPHRAKRRLGILPDRLRTFDRLTGRQLLVYHGLLRRLDRAVAEKRADDLARAFHFTAALSRPVADYSLGMTKKVMLAAAMIHAPRVLVLDEPFESVDPVSSAAIVEVLRSYVGAGGTVLLSSHGMELVERVCDRVAVMVAGQVLAQGTVDEVRGELTLEQRFAQLSGEIGDVESLEWLHTFSD